MKDYLSKIKSVGERAKQNQRAREVEMERACKNATDDIKAMATRISTLLKLATQMYRSGVSFRDFVSSGIYHTLGFIVKYGSGYPNSKPLGIGIEGGGWSGKDFVVGSGGDLIAPQDSMDGYYMKIDGKESLGKACRFLGEFAVFEKNFYEYIDHL